MKSGLVALLSLVLVAAFSGCSEPASVNPMDKDIGAPAEAPMVEEEVVEEAPMEDAAPVEAVAPTDEAPAEPAPADAPAADTAAMDGLTGTTWTHNGITMQFREGNKVFLEGGSLETVAPDGHEAVYTITDGVIEVDVFGQTYTGSWDGTTLSIEGTPAEKVEQ